MFRFCHKHQVLKAIVKFISVDVVDDMAFRDGAIRLFPDQPVHLKGYATKFHNAVSRLADATRLPTVVPRTDPVFPPASITPDATTRLTAIEAGSTPSALPFSFLLASGCVLSVLCIQPFLIGNGILMHIESAACWVFRQSFRYLESKPTSSTANTLARFAAICTRQLSYWHESIVAKFGKGRNLILMGKFKA